MKILIYGAGENGRVALDIFNVSRQQEVEAFVDDAADKYPEGVNGIKVVEPKAIEKLKENGVSGFFVSIGENQKRLKLIEKMKKEGLRPVNAIHLKSCISGMAALGSNVMVCAGAVVNTGAKIQDGVIINTCATIDHDDVIEEGAQISPGVNLAGGVQVKKKAFVGIGAVIIDDVTIGENAFVAAGAVVVRNCPANTRIAGVPAKKIGDD